MEPQEGGDVGREQLTRRMREQDKDWEDTRMRELGSNAILGPTSSPRKRIKEQEEGAGAGIAKKKKRKLKHEVLHSRKDGESSPYVEEQTRKSLEQPWWSRRSPVHPGSLAQHLVQRSRRWSRTLLGSYHQLPPYSEGAVSLGSKL